MRDVTDGTFELLREDDNLALLRVPSRAGGEGVLLLAPVGEPGPQVLALLAAEEAVAGVMDAAFAVRPIGMRRHDGRPALALADPGGGLLRDRLGTPFAIETFLRLGAELARALGHVHGRRVVHRDLRPANVLVGPEGRVWLTGFCRAVATGPRAGAGAPGIAPAQDAMPYAAPEHTGRLNRSADTRGDLYSLGVVFYEMLTGRLPFTASEPMEWMHAHLARQPIPPGRFVPRLPGTIAAIVMTLLAKAPEARYQTAHGVAHDLDRCRSEWTARGAIETFPLGACDTRDHLVVPDRLYGREDETGRLIAAYDRVAALGRPQIALVAGYSGVGKSAIVAATFAALAACGARIASGKFDQLNRDIPFATVAEAFRGVVAEIRGGDALTQALWRDRLRTALGHNGALIVALIPELEGLVGVQPPVPDLSPQDAQHRFQLALERFLAVFATAEQPLALFLDDLQWVDLATLELLSRLMGGAAPSHVLIVGAYRDNEVSASHPLMAMLTTLRATNADVTEVFLGPLTAPDVTTLVADALGAEAGDVEPLARAIMAKTGGNPFFSIQLLTALVDTGEVTFDAGERRWRFDAETIRRSGAVDVIDLMARKLHQLSPASRADLTIFSCLGTVVQADTLSYAYACTRDALETRLAEAIGAGLVFRRADAYAFLHDRVQEAAYGLIPPEARPAVHLRLGRELAAQVPQDQLDAAVFDIVGQLNRGADLIAEPAERVRIAALNLAAGRRAEAAAAYASALGYLAAGRDLIGETPWEDRSDLAFQLEFRSAECEFLTGDLERACLRLGDLAHRPIAPAQRAKVVWLQVTLCTALGDLEHAIALCLEYLRGVGIDLPAHPTMADVMLEFAPIAEEIRTGTVETRLNLVRGEEEIRSKLEVLTAVLPPAFFSDQALVCLVLCRMANLSREEGNCAASALGYAYLGMVLGPVFGDYAAGHHFGRLGLDLSQRKGFARFRGRVAMTFAYHVLPYARPIRSGRELLRRAFELNLEAGDLTYAGYSTCTLISSLLASGDPLAGIERQAEQGLAFLRGAKFGLVADIVTAQLMLTRSLQGLTFALDTFDDGVFDETAFAERLAGDQGLAIAACWYFIRKLQAAVFAGDAQAAVAAAERAAPLLWTTSGHLELVEYHVYDALARAQLLHEAPDEGHRAALRAHRDQIEIWARSAPENFQHHAALVAAEQARIDGDTLAALTLYETAIASARTNGFTHVEGLAHERAASCCRAAGLATMAQSHIERAHAAYRRWGAEGILRRLEAEHPALRQDRALGPMAARGDLAQIDLTTLIRSSEAVSGEVVLSRLVRTLMTIAIENAGARCGLLLLPRSDGLWIEAEAASGPEAVEVTLRQAKPTARDAPLSVIAEAVRTQAPVLLGDAARDGAFTGDPYVALGHGRSLLALPLVRQSKLVGLLYLENAAVPYAFTPARLSVLRLIASQAAISLENAAFEEKESLLKEVHHRVKNNLQLISSLLSLQAARIADPEVAELFMDSRNRVRSMALVHENLYRAGSFARIAMADHVRTLCAHLMRAYGTADRRIGLAVDVDDVDLDLDRAISCGLIINELVSNALKHAFPDGRSGEVKVALKFTYPDRCSLCVGDDGIGLGASWERDETLGLQLVRDLTEQLGGHLEMKAEHGTTFTIAFHLATSETRR